MNSYIVILSWLQVGIRNTPPLDLDVLSGQSLQEAKAGHKQRFVGKVKSCL